MGFSYDSRHRLCCDVCDKSGGVRRVPCPAGYCQDYALCPACRKSPDIRARIAARHVNCAALSASFKAELDAEAAAAAAGHAVLASALGQPDGRVHILFRYATGEYVGAYVKPGVYDSRNKRTLADYPDHEPAPSDFYSAPATAPNNRSITA